MELMGGDIGALTEALSAAQAEMTNALKDAKNPHYKSDYATLASVLDAVRAPLNKHKIALTQHPTTEGNVVTVRTLLTHASGGWLSSACSATAKDASPQSVGSAISYLRRYSLAALCNIAQADDDGNAASQPRGRQQPAQQNGNGRVSEHDRVLAYIEAKLPKIGDAVEIEVGDKKVPVKLYMRDHKAEVKANPALARRVASTIRTELEAAHA